MIRRHAEPCRPNGVQWFEALINEPHQVHGGAARVGTAIGICVSGTGASTADAMLHEADTAMYRAKHAGRAARRGLGATTPG